MRVASLDFGTNTVLCLIADMAGDQIENIIFDAADVVRLGEGLGRTGRFSSEALDRTERVLEKYSQAILKYQPDKILGVATAAARKASNGDELILLCAKFKIPLQIISGDQEAEFTFVGGMSGLKADGNYHLLDVGGGSTEIIFGSRLKKEMGQSFEIGVVKLKELLVTEFPTTKIVLQKLIEQVDEYFAKGLVPYAKQDSRAIVAVAGSPTTLAAMELGKFEASQIDGYILSYNKLIQWIDVLKDLTPEQIVSRFAIDPGRADVILCGSVILARALAHLNKNEYVVSTRGLRFGVASAVASGKLRT